MSLEMNCGHIIKESSWNAQAESVLQHSDVHISALSSFEFVPSCFSVQHSEHATAAHAVPPTSAPVTKSLYLETNSLSNEN